MSFELSIDLVSLRDTEKRVGLTFPLSDFEIEDALKEIGVDDVLDYVYEEIETNIEVDDLEEVLGSYTIEGLSEIFDNLDGWNEDLISAAVELDGHNLLSISEGIGDYLLYRDIDDDWDLGHTIAEETMDVPENLKLYINYERLGQDYRINTHGTHGKWGWIERP